MTLSNAVGVMHQLLPEPHAGLLSGMIFGVRADLNAELYDALITTGTLHIVALSGMNISILIAIIHLLCLKFVSRPIANILACMTIGWFIWFVGPTPSVVRAGIMGTIALIGLTFGRQVWPCIVWALAVSGMILLNPLWVSDLSFQLSAMATLGILLFGKSSQPPPQSIAQPGVDNLGSKFISSTIHSLIQDDLRITLAAQVFTIPIILFAFQRISLISPLTNVLIGWLVAPIMIMGLLLVIIGSISIPLAAPLSWALWVVLSAVINVILLTAKFPFASVSF
jgi:competence protein ComEC